MSASAPLQISSAELGLFLDDIHKNISLDDDTDFKKLTLYLFSFTNARLASLEANTNATDDEEAVLDRLLTTIVLVLSKRKYVLNIELTEAEIRLVLPSKVASGLGDNSRIVYEWVIAFALAWLPRFSAKHRVTNALKSFIIDVINIISVHLHSFKHKNAIKLKLVGVVDRSLNELLANISVANNPDTFTTYFGPKMASTVHLFSIINDYDISNKLLLNIVPLQLKLEHFARKLWFVVKSISTPSADAKSRLVDELMSVLVLNQTNNILLDEASNWASIALVLTWISEFLKAFEESASNRPLLKKVDRSMSYALLRLFIFCHEKGLLTSLFSYLNFNVLSYTATDSTTDLPPFVKKTLHLLFYQYNLALGVLSVVSKYQTTSHNQFIITPFEDEELDFYMSCLLKHQKNNYVLTSDLLGFDLEPKFRFGFFESHNKKHDGPENTSFDLSHWIAYAKNIVGYDRKSSDLNVLNSRTTLYTFITALGHFPCLLHEEYDFEMEECSRCTENSSDRDHVNLELRKSVSEFQETGILYNDLICSYFLDTRRNSVVLDPLLSTNVLLTLFKILTHFKPPMGTLEADKSFLFVMECIRSSKNREVRLLAARTLPLYLLQPKGDDLDANFRLIFLHLSQIRLDSDGGKVYLAESTMKALSEMAVISEGEWLCVLVIKLVDLFGESNDQHVNLAYTSLLYIATAKSLTPYKLLFPFLPSIAERIVKKPRMLQKITELLGISKKFFLNRTREYTTPRFLQYYKHDFIQEIAEASNMTKWKLIVKSLPRIIATYLCKDNVIDEGHIIQVLGAVSPEYRSLTMADLLTSVGEVTWFVLLQILVDEKGNIANESRIANALQYISKLNLLKNNDKAGGEFDYIEYLLGEHVLELVQRFSENVHHIKGSKPYLEKVSSMRAIEYLISKNTNAAASALGQISTCLQATLENPDFELSAIRCWNVLVQNLQTNHLVSLFDIIISLIFQKFTRLEHRSKLIAVDILRKLFGELKQKYNSYSLYYFSVPFIKDLDLYYQFDSSFRNVTRPKTKSGYFPEFSRRLKTNNNYVVQQALDDLINFTEKYQKECQEEDFKDPLLEHQISDLIKTLLDTAATFKNTNSPVAVSCAKALAIIGSLDANKFNFKTIKKQITIIYDFKDYKENADFLRHFMEKRVIKIFWASNDPIKQLFSAYSMQKFLQVLRLDVKVLDASSQDFLLDVWNSFSDIAKSTLTPLLNSKYVAPHPRYEPLQYPYYKVGMKHEKWLVDFTSNLLRRPNLSIFEKDDKNLSKNIIFQTCSMLVRDQDISICQYLLKYITLSHIINGDASVLADIKTEFLSILHLDSTTTSSDRVEQLKSCYQSIFEVLDYFNEWVSAATHHLSNSNLKKAEGVRLKKNRSFVVAFLESIPMELIALKSAECDSYERTILYLEKCFRDDRVDETYKIDNLSVVTTLQSMYSNINDFDALDGILQKFSTNNLADKLVTFQYNENWSIAQESFQVLSESGSNSDKIENHTKMLKSLGNHALYDEVLSSLSAKINLANMDSLPIEWSMVGLQAAVSSGDIEQIKRWIFVSNSVGKAQDTDNLITYKFAESLVSLHEANMGEYLRHVEETYKMIGSSLVASISSSFSRNAALMGQLHAMYDVSLIAAHKHDFDKDHESILKYRLANADQGFDSQWRILSMHRVANQLIENDGKISDILLSCSQLARKNERLDVSTRCIMKAMVLNDQESNIEYAELLWAQAKQTEAIKTLHEIVCDDKFKNDHQKANAQLQYANWLDESNHSSASTIISEYTKAYKLEVLWEKPYYDLGKYYNKLKESQEDPKGFYEQQIIRFFLRSLALGPTYIFEALPKLITVWLDFAVKEKKSVDAERKLNHVLSDISKSLDGIPIYVWYTSITQLLSRIVHGHDASAQMLYKIITKLVEAYPKHSLWYILSHLNSNDKVRRERVSGILRGLQSSSATLSASILDAKALFSSLITVANHKILKKSVKRMSLSSDFGIRNLSGPNDALVIPVRSNLEIRLPAVKHLAKASNAFPKSSTITFDGVDDNVNIFYSLQMPRQLTVRGIDNRPYRLLVKKDDTRKDAKVVEFTTMINRILSASTEARKRNLSIANYSVIPLAENMGVIEFVLDVATMKSIVNEQRKRLGEALDDKTLFRKLDEAQQMVKSKNESAESTKKLLALFDRMCTEVPPVLHNWFIDQFSDPTSWYLARSSFTRSSAVTSMVGYIIGLGDRHCENILFFKNTGSVLHIDFDCLFDKGRTLPTPEIVPFRLTQNMVDAMGISGIEGTFRITCEVTGTLLRENEAPLMSILETLLYDPLLDWKTHHNPKQHLSKVRRKIRGLVDEKEGLPMNIHGHVDVLIQEASSNEKLCRMYGGWAPYI